MKIGDLARDPALAPTTLQGFDLSMRRGFITVRVREMLRSQPTLQAAGNAFEVKDTQVATVKSRLQTDITAATAAVTAMKAAVQADVAADKMLKLDDQNVDPLLVEAYVRFEIIETSPQAYRDKLVENIVLWATAMQPDLLATDAQTRDRLRLMVDRRLRVVERMLYYVAVDPNEVRGDPGVIGANLGGPWNTTFPRTFEYPRISPGVVFDACNPDNAGACQNPALSGWRRGAGGLVRSFKVADAAAAFWQVPTTPDPEDYIRFYRPEGGSAADAVRKIFTASLDFKKRNLLACDHVIHLLQLEALLEAGKRLNGSDAWFNTVESGKPLGWLRIGSPWGDPPVPAHRGEFLGGYKETFFFEHVEVPTVELQIGDHLIVYNHPVYQQLTATGVFGLENSIVVQLHPKLLVQGHGVLPQQPAEIRAKMLGELKDFLDSARQLVMNQMDQVPATGFPFIQLEGKGRLTRRVEPAQSDFSTGNKEADWWVHWAPSHPAELAALESTPAGAQQRAFLRDRQKVELVRANDPAFAGKPTGAFFPLWQPTPTGANKVPHRNQNGKIDMIDEVEVDARMVSVWGGYIRTNPLKRDISDVIRPKV